MEPSVVDTRYINLNFEWLLGTRRVFNIDNTNTRRQLLKFGSCEAITPTTNGIVAAEANILRRVVAIVAVGCSWPDMVYNLILLNDTM